MSKALLSIPLPLSGQLLPFSQFQLEIEGKEHEEGFFVAGRQTNTHIPVVLEPEALDSMQESNVLWEPVEQTESESLRDSTAPANHEQNSKSKTWLNLLLLVFVLALTVFGLMQTSGISWQELNDLWTGGVDHQVMSRPSRSIKLNPIAKPSQIKANQDQTLHLVSPIVDPTKQPKDALPRPNSQKNDQVKARTKLKPKPALKSKASKRSKTKRRRSKSKSAKGFVEKNTKKSSKKRSKKRRRKRKSAIKDPFTN